MTNVTKYIDKQGNEVNLNELIKGKTKNQVNAIKFFHGIPIKEGCLNKEYLSYDGYMDIVKSKRDELNDKRRAMKKLGIDEEQIKEIDPICFEGFRYEYRKLNPYVTYKDSNLCSSMYEITWLFFGDDQLYIYNYTFDTTDDNKSDTTFEYFYKDITAFVTNSDSIQKKVWETSGEGCSTKTESKIRNITSDLFEIKVPGDSFSCALSSSEKYTNSISAMKQKLREKKNK